MRRYPAATARTTTGSSGPRRPRRSSPSPSRWQTSYYADRWDVMIAAIQYHLGKHPELAADTRNAARMYGRLAFAYGASGMPGQARRWARRSIRLNWRQPRGYLAVLVAAHLL